MSASLVMMARSCTIVKQIAIRVSSTGILSGGSIARSWGSSGSPAAVPASAATAAAAAAQLWEECRLGNSDGDDRWAEQVMATDWSAALGGLVEDDGQEAGGELTSASIARMLESVP